MAYRIIDRLNTTATINGVIESVCAIYCDSAEDLPNSQQILQDAIGAGSWAWLADEDTFATLKTTKEWKISGE